MIDYLKIKAFKVSISQLKTIMIIKKVSAEAVAKAVNITLNQFYKWLTIGAVQLDFNQILQLEQVLNISSSMLISQKKYVQN